MSGASGVPGTVPRLTAGSCGLHEDGAPSRSKSVSGTSGPQELREERAAALALARPLRERGGVSQFGVTFLLPSAGGGYQHSKVLQDYRPWQPIALSLSAGPMSVRCHCVLTATFKDAVRAVQSRNQRCIPYEAVGRRDSPPQSIVQRLGYCSIASAGLPALCRTMHLAVRNRNAAVRRDASGSRLATTWLCPASLTVSWTAAV